MLVEEILKVLGINCIALFKVNIETTHYQLDSSIGGNIDSA